MTTLEIPLMEHPTSTGVCSFISWPRLVRELQKTGEVRPEETVVSLRVTTKGITFQVKAS